MRFSIKWPLRLAAIRRLLKRSKRNQRDEISWRNNSDPGEVQEEWSESSEHQHQEWSESSEHQHRETFVEHTAFQDRLSVEHTAIQNRVFVDGVAGSGGYTALRDMCFRQDASVHTVRKLINETPNALDMADCGGWLPIHHAADFGASAEVVGELLENNPKSASAKDRAGRTPLHWAVHGTNDSSLEAIRLVCLASPGSVWSSAGDSRFPVYHYDAPSSAPIEYVATVCSRPDRLQIIGTMLEISPVSSPIKVAQVNEIIRKISGRYFPMWTSVSCLEAYMAEDNRIKDACESVRWAEIELLLRAAYDGDMAAPGASKPTRRAVHASIALGCPPEIVLFAMALFPEQITERDNQGLFPIQLVAESQVQSSSSRRSLGWNDVVRRLLQTNETLAQVPDEKGSFLLNLALKNGRHWCSGVEQIFRAAPSVVYSRDLDTNLFPFMVAAAHKQVSNFVGDEEERGKEEYDNDLSQVETIFELLKANPSPLIEATLSSTSTITLSGLSRILWMHRRRHENVDVC